MSWLRRTRQAPAPDVLAHPGATPELTLRDLRTTIDGRVLIEWLSSTTNAGQLQYMVGPNGAGKPTWLSVLTSLHSEDDGSVTFDSIAFVDRPVLAMACHHAFPPRTLYDSFPITVYQAVMTGRHPHLARWEWEDDADTCVVDAAVSVLHLQPLAQHDVCTLSGDERQRVAIAAVMAQEARVLLFDEPVTHLNLHQQIAALHPLREGCHKHGRLVVPTMHDSNLAYRYVTHALLVDGEGQTIADIVADVLTPGHYVRVLRASIIKVADGRRTASTLDNPDGDWRQ